MVVRYISFWHKLILINLFLGGKIDAKAAAALIAAAASGGDPEIANKIIEKMLAGIKNLIFNVFS